MEWIISFLSSSKHSQSSQKRVTYSNASNTSQNTTLYVHSDESEINSYNVNWERSSNTLLIEKDRHDNGLILQKPIWCPYTYVSQKSTNTSHHVLHAQTLINLPNTCAYVSANMQPYHPSSNHTHQNHNIAAQSTDITSSITGRVVQVNVQPGDHVSEKACLMIIEAMKMENKIFSPATGNIDKVYVKEGEGVSVGSVICTLTCKEKP